jgi:thioredoxin 1
MVRISIFIAIAGFIIFWMSFMSPKVNFENDAEQGIQFHKGSWNEALAKAKAENKLIFLDIYATWCGPCKQLKSRTFSNAEVGKYFNERFINVALDGEKDDGYKLANDFSIRGFPSLFFIDAKGKIIKRTTGFHTSDDLIKFAQSVSKR